jgi:hypothetical protein
MRRTRAQLCVHEDGMRQRILDQMELFQTIENTRVDNLHVAAERRRIAEATNLQKQTFEHMREANQLSTKQVAPANK